MTETLGRRALNRATLDRQMLLRRTDIPVIEAVERQIGLNAQDPDPPYVALWTRLSGFDRDGLARLHADRAVVRSTMMRGTQFLVSAADFLALRPVLQPVLDRVRRGGFGRATEGVDPAELVELTEKLLADRTLTRPALGRLLAERWPDHDPGALAWSAQYLVPVIHPPSRPGATPFVLAVSWLDRPLSTGSSPEALIRRYLAAFGPGSVRDIQAWSGLTRLREPVDGMALRTFRDEHGQVLYDLPQARRPDPDTPAPVRLLPWFDNVVLGHADRRRVISDEHRKLVCIGPAVKPTVLVDGEVRGVWTVDRQEGRAILAIEYFTRLSPAQRAAVTEEALRLLAFTAPDRVPDVRFAPHP